ncbi:MAG: polyhydroxyalkanoic acid system family protein [Planctomycetaceae bacterium]|nr:polyhydroxyalkanoic acid system family protein [Planctomycetaceae bacterium]
MSEMKFAVKHDRTLQEARDVLEKTIADAQFKFGFMIDKVEWNADRTQADVTAKGAEIKAWVDPTEVHLTLDIPMLNKFLGGPIVQNLKGLVEDNFQKKLTDDSV